MSSLYFFGFSWRAGSHPTHKAEVSFPEKLTSASFAVRQLHPYG